MTFHTLLKRWSSYSALHPEETLHCWQGILYQDAVAWKSIVVTCLPFSKTCYLMNTAESVEYRV